MLDQSKKYTAQKTNKGFSLIEVIIAFTVITITAVSAALLLSSTIRSNEENTLRLQAYMLAQEGLEGIRNVRDSNWAQNFDFKTNDTSLWGGQTNIYPKAESKDLIIEYIEGSTSKGNGATWRLTPALSEESTRLYLQDSNGIKTYTHSSGEETPFKRKITITKTFPDIEKIKVNDETQNIDENLMIISSKVSYFSRGKEQEITLNTILTDWKTGPL